jgi:hypothetical protein
MRQERVDEVSWQLRTNAQNLSWQLTTYKWSIVLVDNRQSGTPINTQGQHWDKLERFITMTLRLYTHATRCHRVFYYPLSFFVVTIAWQYYILRQYNKEIANQYWISILNNKCVWYWANKPALGNIDKSLCFYIYWGYWGCFGCGFCPVLFLWKWYLNYMEIAVWGKPRSLKKFTCTVTAANNIRVINYIGQFLNISDCFLNKAQLKQCFYLFVCQMNTVL